MGCEKCGVEVTTSKVRRERMAHIELASPMSHIWFIKNVPSKVGTLLDISMKDLDKILYFENYVVTEPGLTTLSKGQLITEDELGSMLMSFGENSFVAMTGSEAIQKLLQEINLDQLLSKLQ